ncbi:Ger(x)C family spore germination protein [Caproicibacter fermentans]|uniref:Ger(X)C family spore germination protein n=1 Tax=Caproicibacter fermentans TaxID=2576756 RepID=A0A7G8T7I8_9FIRM|nr:Ger(x)C family spore germination protein [Caproicibacter fermentans]QNK39579.1 Ger(x)C family spore germination protein [Caproicibacter fermentans]
MKKVLKTMIVILEAAIILFIFSGCWDYHELEAYSIVAGMAIDKGQNGYKYHVTFECVKMSGSGKSQQIEPLLLNEDGNTIFDAVRSTLRESDKKLYFSHCKVLIVGSDIAKDGLRSVLDWMQRDAEPRLTLSVLVSKEKTAEEILRVKPQSVQLLSFQIASTLQESTGFYGSPTSLQLYEVTNILNSDGLELVLPAIEKKPEVDGDTVQLSGGAVFKKDKQIGWLSPNQDRYYNYVRDKIKGGLLVTGPTPGSTNVTLEIIDSKTTVKPSVSGQSASVEINVKMRAAYAEQDNETDFLSKIGLAQVEKYAEKTLEFEIESNVKNVQQRFDSDIFGFGSKIHQSSPNDWNKLSKSWDRIFKAMKVKVNAEVKIENTGLSLPKVGD